MARKRFIDLSISIEPDLPSDPAPMIPKIDYMDHEGGADQMAQDFFRASKRSSYQAAWGGPMKR